MSIESFHRSLHGAGNAEPLLVRLRAITKIEDPALMLEAGEESAPGNWAEWNSSSESSTGLS